MMNTMCHLHIDAENKARRLAFLAAFLDDTTVRDRLANTRTIEGPCAAFTTNTIEVRDFAAMQIASLLDFDDRPNEFWTKDDWTQLRNKVRTALNKPDSLESRPE